MRDDILPIYEHAFVQLVVDADDAAFASLDSTIPNWTTIVHQVSVYLYWKGWTQSRFHQILLLRLDPGNILAKKFIENIV